MEREQFYTILLCQNVGPYSIHVGDINKMYLIIIGLQLIQLVQDFRECCEYGKGHSG
jgi:hypothetical protein